MSRLWCAMLLLLSAVATAQAHRLTIGWVCAEGILEIEATAGTEPAAGAELQINDAAGTVLAEDVLDAKGRYRWPVSGAAPVTIEIHAGLGHQRSLALTEADLKPGLSGAPAAAPPLASSAAESGNRGSSDAGFSETVRVGLGLTFLLALAAAWMGYRNSRRLAALERRLDRHEG